MVRIPWQLKIAGKIVASRLPVGYGSWRRLSLFRHGRMERPAYAHKVVLTHLQRAGFAEGTAPATVLELGPGDSLASAVILHALGARRIFLLDAGRFARRDFAPYAAVIAFLRDLGHPMDHLLGVASLDDLLKAVGAVYLHQGLSSWPDVPDHSVDLVWSQAVLEHIRRAEFGPLAAQMHRVLKPDGVASHRVDLKDHLGGALNNLRFSQRVWEGRFMAQSGFYTNRLRFAAMDEHFRRAGFTPDYLSVDRWEALPTARARLAPEFRDLSEQELLVSGFDVLLRPSGPVADPSAGGE